MVRPYSLDLRERVVAAADAGQSCRTVADRFGVSVASVVKWRQRARATGSPAAKRMGSRRPVLLAGRRAWILQRMSVRPHSPQHQRADGGARRGGHDCQLWRSLDVPAPARLEPQKKAYAPASRIDPTSPDVAPAGKGISLGLMPGG